MKWLWYLMSEEAGSCAPGAKNGPKQPLSTARTQNSTRYKRSKAEDPGDGQAGGGLEPEISFSVDQCIDLDFDGPDRLLREGEIDCNLHSTLAEEDMIRI
jgi:hypothetical protein